MLTGLEDMRYEVIAASAGVPAGTAMSRIGRATRSSVFSGNGTPFSRWKRRPTQSGRRSELRRTLSRIGRADLPAPLLVVSGIATVGELTGISTGGFASRQGGGAGERLSIPEVAIMNNDNRSDGGRGGRAVLPPTGMPAGDSFESWLQKQLDCLYGEIVGEPVPDSLMRLIDNDAAAGGAKKERAS